jgi:hypothetical protein
MLELVASLGFSIENDAEDAAIKHVVVSLGA